jgi:hypothetical protein
MDCSWGRTRRRDWCGRASWSARSLGSADKEIKSELSGVRRIVTVMFLEYARCWLPMNSEALVKAISKSGVTPETLHFVGAEMPAKPSSPPIPVIAMTPLYEIEKAIERATKSLDAGAIVRSLVEDAAGRLLGKV